MAPFLNLAKRIAKRSPHKSFTHSAIIFKGNAIYSHGFNFQNEHAETSAIKNAPWVSELKGCTMLVIRVTRGKDLLANSRPCPDCERALKRVGIKKVLFSTADRKIEMMRI